MHKGAGSTLPDPKRKPLRPRPLNVILFVFVLLALPCAGCQKREDALSENMAVAIYLYGERHGSKPILEKELTLWSDYYHKENMRHLFIEVPYYTAKYLNLWLEASDDQILDALYADWEGAAIHNQDVLDFYRSIKAECPETIFHGTDVGHQYTSTGIRYLNMLSESGQKDSQAYEETLRCMEQGALFYSMKNSGLQDEYREDRMAENFIRNMIY